MTLPVLLPPDPAPARGLPPLVAWIATLGLAVLGLIAVPATLERRRLDEVHARLAQAIVRQEAELERWERMRHEARQPSYLRERALRVLLGAGRQEAAREARAAPAARTAPGTPGAASTPAQPTPAAPPPR
jgi:hypothetical protein